MEKFGKKKRTRSQIGKASKRKGAAGERELAHYLTDKGFPARRGQQFKGGEDSPDIVCEALSEYNIECKRTERLSLYKALDQSVADCGEDQKPLVIHRQSKKGWVAVLRLEDFLLLCENSRINPDNLDK